MKQSTVNKKEKRMNINFCWLNEQLMTNSQCWHWYTEYDLMQWETVYVKLLNLRVCNTNYSMIASSSVTKCRHISSNWKGGTTTIFVWQLIFTFFITFPLIFKSPMIITHNFYNQHSSLCGFLLKIIFPLELTRVVPFSLSATDSWPIRDGNII